MGAHQKASMPTYESNLPPFLQRLHAQHTGNRDVDRHERQLARPRKANTHDEDDGPTVVDEQGETLSKEEYEKRLDGDGNEKAAGEGSLAADSVSDGTVGQDSKMAVPQPKTSVTNGASLKKRKAVKVIAEEGEEVPPAKTGETSVKPIAKKVKKTKAKPVKLDFDDDPM